jgi:hypothetical protein
MKHDEKNRGRIVIRRTLTQAAMIARELKLRMADPSPREQRVKPSESQALTLDDTLVLE